MSRNWGPVATWARWLGVLVAGALLATSCAASQPESGSPATAGASARPNIVFVLTDDLTWNLLPYLPHVQAMQQAGLSFSDYTVTDSLCCPSRSSIFSGRFPHDTGVFTNGGNDGGFTVFHSRGEESQTFATALQTQGYRTALMGKYLNGYKPNFTEGGAAPYVPPGWTEWDGIGKIVPDPTGDLNFNYDLNENGHVVHHGSQPTDYLTDVLSGKAISFITSAAAAHTPFAIEIATYAPHQPYTPAPRDAEAFPGLAAPKTPAFNQPNVDAPSWLVPNPALSASEISGIDADFRKRAQAVQAIDVMIGHLEDTLKSAGVAANTYLVFSSDNGYHMGEHRLMPGKMTAFDTDIAVPLVIVGPGVPAGRTTGALAQNIDLAPTFEQLAGARIPDNVDGRSLVPLWTTPRSADWRTGALIEHHGPDLDRTDPDHPLTTHSGNPTTYEALRTPTGTYIEYANGEVEYYDRIRDPDELTNIAGNLPPEQRAALHTTLQALQNCHDHSTCWTAGHPK